MPAENTNIILGRVTERFEKGKFTDSLLAVTLPDGTIGQILMKNGKAFLYSKDGSPELNAYKDNEGNWTSNFTITGSLELKGDLVASGKDSKLLFPDLKPGALYINADHKLSTSVEDDLTDIDESESNFDYRPLFVKSGTNQTKKFTDDGFLYNPFKNELTIKNSIKTPKIYNENEILVKSEKTLDLEGKNIRVQSTQSNIQSPNITINEVKIQKFPSNGDIVTNQKQSAFTLELDNQNKSGICFNEQNVTIYSSHNENLIHFFSDKLVSFIKNDGSYQILDKDGKESVLITTKNEIPPGDPNSEIPSGIPIFSVVSQNFIGFTDNFTIKSGISNENNKNSLDIVSNSSITINAKHGNLHLIRENDKLSLTDLIEIKDKTNEIDTVKTSVQTLTQENGLIKNKIDDISKTYKADNLYSQIMSNNSECITDFYYDNVKRARINNKGFEIFNGKTGEDESVDIYISNNKCLFSSGPFNWPNKFFCSLLQDGIGFTYFDGNNSHVNWLRIVTETNKGDLEIGTGYTGKEEIIFKKYYLDKHYEPKTKAEITLSEIIEMKNEISNLKQKIEELEKKIKK